jgi:putative spermidine/putrescine transport system permease protein
MKFSRIFLNAYALLIALLLIYPTIELFIVGFSDDVVFPPRYFSLDAFGDILWTFWESLKFSVELGLAVTVATILVSLPTAYAVERLRLKGRALLETLIVMPLVFPDISYMSAMFVYFARYLPYLLNNFWGVMIATVAFNILYMYRSIRSSFASCDPVYEEAAMCLGASRLRTFFTITLRLVAPGLLTGSLIVLVNSSTAFIAPITLATTITSTATRQIMRDLNEFGLIPYIAVESLIVEVLIMSIVLAVYLFFRKEFRGLVF